MADEGQKKLNFIENVLPRMILERNDDLKNHVVVKCAAEACSQLDGFMSTIYSVVLTLRDSEGVDAKHKMIVKIMKGDKTFRDATKSDTQCSNEVYIYKYVIPYFQKFVAESGAEMKPDWVPRVYYADFDMFPELGEEKETVLAMENLKPLGYRVGPRIDLDGNHLKLMIRNIAKYHAVSYAMRIKKDPMLDELPKGLVPFSFLHPNGDELDSYRIFFVVSLERFFAIAENAPEYEGKTKFLETVQKFKDQYFQKPLTLMQKFLRTDDVFSLILHGDYNRNNVMFQYDSAEGFENPKDIKMVDFQEVRYATPVIDLTFFMYMNLPTSLREELWDELLELYHHTLIASITDLLKCNNDDPRLEPYSLKNFLDHFKQFAFYGIIIGIHFIPWMACPEDECQKVSDLFETSIHSQEFRDFLQVCGGKDVDDRIKSIVLHSYEKGYMDIFG